MADPPKLLDRVRGFGIPLRRICSNADRTFGPCRNCWGHRDVATTMIYTHVLGLGAKGVRSPLDPA